MALETLWDAARNYVGKTGVYKVRDLWEHVLEPYCQRVLGKEAPECSDPGFFDPGKAPEMQTEPDQKCPAGFN